MTVWQALAIHSKDEKIREYVSQIFENLGGKCVVKFSPQKRNAIASSINDVMAKLHSSVQEKAKKTINALLTGIPLKKKKALPETASIVEKEEQLMVCGLPSCTKVEEDGAKFKKCSQCYAISYCSLICQKEHWRIQHKRVCVPCDK